MANWRKIYFNSFNVERMTARAFLINMPRKSDYDGYRFWYPAKLVRNEGGKGYHLSLLFTDKTEFDIRKYGKRGKLLDKVILSPEAMLKAFEGVNEQIGHYASANNKSYLVVEEPTKIEKTVTVDNELKRG